MKLKSVALLSAALLTCGIANAQQPAFQVFKIVKSVPNGYDVNAVTFKNVTGATAPCTFESGEGLCSNVQSVNGINNGELIINLRATDMQCSSWVTKSASINLNIVNSVITVPAGTYTFAAFPAECKADSGKTISVVVTGNAESGYVLSIQ